MNLKKLYLGKVIGFIILLAILCIAFGFNALNNHVYDEKQADAAPDPLDAIYIVEGVAVQLKGGMAESEVVKGGASKIVTKYFGNEAAVDVNGDGRSDIVFLLTQETGGSGVFYYVVAALNTPRGYVGSEAYLIGDRIAPQSTEAGGVGTVIVNYADRAEGESFAMAPSIAKTVRLKFNPASQQFFSEDSDKSDLIRLTNPLPNQEVKSPIIINGEARGNWYFEATFPIYLTDWDGRIIAEGYATAEKEWMTTEFVPFTATLTYNPADIAGGYSNKGTLILKKANASGLPEHDDALEIPVVMSSD